MQLLMEREPETPEKKKKNHPYTAHQNFFSNLEEKACSCCEGTGWEENSKCSRCKGLGKAPLIQDTFIPWDPERIERDLDDIEKTGQRQHK